MPWHCPGVRAARPANVVTGQAYRGINALALWAAAQTLSQPTPLWGTYRQWRMRGAGVRRGERATTIVFWKSLVEEEGGGEPRQSGHQPDGRVVARGYSVFNECQVEGFVGRLEPQLGEERRLERAERFWTNLGVDTLQDGGEAYYNPTTDTVVVPAFSAFADAPAAYAVRFHEGVHATGAAHRCSRPLDGRFGSEAYAMEELCAELGSALILADLTIGATLRPDHARYIASWLRVLRGDVRAVFKAASHAQTAVDWMHAQQPPQTEPLDGLSTSDQDAARRAWARGAQRPTEAILAAA
jgi:antirestriction protein ArdC